MAGRLYKHKALIVAISVLLTGLVVGANQLPAGFVAEDQLLTIEIDGIDFGRVDQISGMQALIAATEVSMSDDVTEFSTPLNIRVHRDFVTSPSLYLWAKNIVASRAGAQRVSLVTRNVYGDELARITLKSCQPLSWTVEATGSGAGGFHEALEMAVHGVELD